MNAECVVSPMSFATETIAAISTPFGEGAIALLRMSGPGALEIANAVFHGKQRPSDAPARVVQFGMVQDGERKIDDVLLTVFRAPHSYTGEDVIEITGHGGVLVTRRVLDLLLAKGARSAEPGEFTQRAYLNGKMDLTQAEAVMDLISAQTDLALRAATEQLEGRLGERIRGLRDAVLEVLAHVEACIDFPEEDIDPQTGAALLARLNQICAEIDVLLATAGEGKILREGVRTVICGAPNVGKSSLLNLLLGAERAIVSSRPGTTRDVIEEVINFRGIPLRLADTAGVRESTDELERAGIERTHRALAGADLVLHVVDANQSNLRAAAPQRSTPAASTPMADQTPVLRGAARELLVLNKIDLGEHEMWRGVEAVRLSCRTSEGMDALGDAIVARVMSGGSATRGWAVAINARHQAHLGEARRFTEAARQALTDGLSPEFVAEELRAALSAVADVVGGGSHEELLGKIFSTFCIGK